MGNILHLEQAKLDELNKNYNEVSDSVFKIPFSQIANQVLNNDYKLSTDAFAILCHMLHHKKGYQVSDAKLMEIWNMGKHRLKSAFQDLRSKGLVKKEAVRNPNGTIKYWLSKFSYFPEFLKGPAPSQFNFLEAKTSKTTRGLKIDLLDQKADLPPVGKYAFCTYKYNTKICNNNNNNNNNTAREKVANKLVRNLKSNYQTNHPYLSLHEKVPKKLASFLKGDYRNNYLSDLPSLGENLNSAGADLDNEDGRSVPHEVKNDPNQEFVVVNELKKLLDEREKNCVSIKQLKKWLEAFGEDRVRECIGYALKNAQRSLGGFLRRILEMGWSVNSLESKNSIQNEEQIDMIKWTREENGRYWNNLPDEIKLKKYAGFLTRYYPLENHMQGKNILDKDIIDHPVFDYIMELEGMDHRDRVWQK